VTVPSDLPSVKKLTPKELQHHEFVHAIGLLVGDRTAHASWLFDVNRARDPHIVLPLRHDKVGNNGLLIRLEHLQAAPDREYWAWVWYCRVRTYGGGQGVRTPIGVLFRKELIDGAAVLGYLGTRAKAKIVPRTYGGQLARATEPDLFNRFNRPTTFRKVRQLVRRLKGSGEAVWRQRKAIVLVARGYTVEEIEQAIPRGRSAYNMAIRKIRALNIRALMIRALMK